MQNLNQPPSSPAPDRVDQVLKKALAIKQDPTAAHDDISSSGIQWVNRSPTRVSEGELKRRAVNQAKVPRPNPAILNITPSSDGRLGGAPINVVNPDVRVLKHVWLVGDEHQINVRIGARGSSRVRSDQGQPQNRRGVFRPSSYHCDDSLRQWRGRHLLPNVRNDAHRRARIAALSRCRCPLCCQAPAPDPRRESRRCSKRCARRPATTARMTLTRTVDQKSIASGRSEDL
jgi:hypothetical protein